MPNRKTDDGRQKLILMHLLERPGDWTRAGLKALLYDVDPDGIDAALTALADVGAVTIDGERIAASPCVRLLDSWEVICI